MIGVGSIMNNLEQDDKIENRKQFYRNGLLTGMILGMAIILAVFIGFSYILKKYVRENEKEPVIDPEHIETIEAKIKTIERYLNQYYYEDYTEETLVNGIYYGMVASLGDPYTGYYTPDDYKELMQSSSGEYCGIGVLISRNTNTGEIVIKRVYSGSPAEEAGLQKGDLITALDGQLLKNMGLEDLSAIVLGEEGTDILVTVLRNGETIDFNITRREIQMDTVSYEMKEDGIGYISIEEFDDVTPDQVKNALNDLMGQGMKGIVLDLRNNPGGGLRSLTKIVSMFVEGKKLFLYSETKDGERENYYTTGDVILPDLPMVILIDQGSASAAEAFTGAMKCFGRATLVGTTTFGKGIMQSIFSLKDGSALKITTGKYFLPDGNNIHKIGIEPDYEVEAAVEGDIDPQLEKALELFE